jgi:hypothetical protein
LSQDAGKSFVETVSKNPMLVAGIGLLLGGLIASALPRSRVEDGVMGAAASGARKRARDTLDQGVEAVKDTASAVVESVTSSAEQEGFTADDLGNGAREIGQRARKVAEAGIAAMDVPSQNKH